MTARYFTLKLETSKTLPEMAQVIENRLSTLDGVEDVNSFETLPDAANLERVHPSGAIYQRTGGE